MTETRTSEERVVSIARCPEHGLHGQREECFVCGGPVEQVEMVPALLLDQALDITKEATDALDAGVHRAQLVLQWTALRAKLSDTEDTE